MGKFQFVCTGRGGKKAVWAQRKIVAGVKPQLDKIGGTIMGGEGAPKKGPY